ncbi:MAG: MBL fold metallo-hydrolase [Nitriliruptorales bacterium]|nr:MBL fold metallo-hydrolase [Nitriliruptorales bacterium]
MGDADRSDEVEIGAPAPPVERTSDGYVAIDTLTGGMSQVTAGYLVPAPRPALIECGPALSIDNVIAGLTTLGLDAGDLAYLIVTHIHLDHAGGAGDVAEAFPNATVVVSEVGAPHLHDPERLNRSSERVYGPLFETVYGACTPIEEDRLLAVEDGHDLDLGGGRTLELLYTPGHAKHHIGIFDHDTGAIFSGDSVGVKVPGMRHLRPATPPPDFHYEAALRSLTRYRDRDPSRVYLAHYGAIDPPDESLADAQDRLTQWVETAEEAWREVDDAEHELDHVAETLARRFADEVDEAAAADDPESRERLELLTPVVSNAAGLVRYLRRRDEGTLTEIG